MFSKVLLLLAVCFQALRTGNSANHVESFKNGFQIGQSVKAKAHIQPQDGLYPESRAEWVEKIQDGFQIGKLVNVLIQPHEYPRPDCKIWLQETKTGDSGDSLLISFVGSARRFLINSYVNGKWQEEENEYDIDIYQPITVDIMTDETSFLITFKGKQYIREYEFPSKNIKFMKVECPKEGKVDVQADWHNECSCKA